MRCVLKKFIASCSHCYSPVLELLSALFTPTPFLFSLPPLVLSVSSSLLLFSPPSVRSFSSFPLPLLSTPPSHASPSQAKTEDDILYEPQLPAFGDTLTQEDAEALMSLLCVPYSRVPLVLGFFLAQDRANVLLNTQLQELLQSTLLGQGTWISK